MERKLAQVYPDTYVEIVDIKTDVELLKRLAELGFIPGEKIHVITNNWGKYVVVESSRGRFGLPVEIAEKIIVRELYGFSMRGAGWRRGWGRSRRKRCFFRRGNNG